MKLSIDRIREIANKHLGKNVLSVTEEDYGNRFLIRISTKEGVKCLNMAYSELKSEYFLESRLERIRIEFEL